MKIIAGIDIGNATTETAIGRLDGSNVEVISSGISWCCKKHIADKDSCSMKFIHEEAFQSAFTTMLNKLIFSRKIFSLKMTW